MIFKNFFRETNVISEVRNPWAGLSSYDDPINIANPLKFCGRDEESLDVFNLIDDNIVVTLYGKSGIGKTSLLNAGVFPLLRDNNYTPIYVRLGANVNNEGTFALHIVDILSKRIKEIYGNESIEIVDIVPENTNPESEDFLWNYFARRKFVNESNDPIFPVIVFDQFEESIKLQRNQSSLLLKQIAYLSNRQNMLKDTYINEQVYSYNYNFRFVISIREDDLFRLEDIISTNYLTFLRNGRYRLHNLSSENAKSIIQNVGAHFINPTDLDEITGLIIDISKGAEDGFIRTNVISLICSRLFDLMLKSGQNMISISDVKDYLSSDPFEEYYTNAIKSLSEGEKRYIESNLVSSDGRRNIMPESSLKNAIRSFEMLINGYTPIFHRIQSITGENLIELIHDGICPIVIKHRAIRLEKKNKTILSLCLLIFGLLGIWMLNTSVVNEFVSFFLTMANHGIKSLKFNEVLSITELLSITLMPIAIGAMVYDDKRKKRIALIALLIFTLPSLLYPISASDKFRHGLSQIVSNYNTYGGVEDILIGLSNSTYVLIVYTLCMLILCITNFLGKPGLKTDRKFWYNLWNTKSVKLYLWIIATFLFYKSIFNTGYFIIDSFDSSWGIVIIPLLTLNLFGINLKEKRRKYSFVIYTLLLVILTGCSVFEIFLSIDFQIILIIICFFLIFSLYFNNNLIKTCCNTLCNIAILTIVILLNNGYNPLSLDDKNICKVYPWKIVITDNQNKFGIYDANYGDTLLIPQFQRESTRSFNYYTILPKNNYTDTISGISVGYASLPFPLKLDKTGLGEWRLTLMYSPNYEYAINKIAHKEEADSTEISDKEGACLFIKLRNDISKFCITGDESILLSDVSSINNYEKTVKYNLQNSLQQLSNNDSVMTEEMVVPFIKAISRSLYMNMLKEAILKAHYNDFIGWFESYYIATALTSVTSESGIMWSNNFNYNWNLSLNSDGNSSYSSYQTNGFCITLDGLNNDRVYAWNNLYNALYLLECNAYSTSYASNIQNKIKDDNLIWEEILNSENKIRQILLNYKSELETQNSNLNKLLLDLTDLNNKKQTLSTDGISKIISNVIEVNNISNKVKKGVRSEMNLYGQEMDSISISFKEIALQQADFQFREIVINTFDSLMRIIQNNPINAYNGVLISLCQKLYVIGVLRGYNMEEYTKQMNILETYNTEPMYGFVKEVNNSFKERTQMYDTFRKQLSSYKLEVKQLLE